MEPKYPQVTARLTATDGNAFSIIGKVIKAMRNNKLPDDAIKQFTEEATSGDYNKLLATCMKWVNVA